MKKTVLLIVMLACIAFVSPAQESEHPPLAENTKKAIATYRRNPTQENKDALFKILNENYDDVIKKKKDKLAERIENREKNVGRWMRSVDAGDVPPFLKLNTENHKGKERKVVADAIDAYRKDHSEKNRDAVWQALYAYYDVFLEEQRKHIKDTENSREERMAMSLERFTSGKFMKRHRRTKSNLTTDEALAEIICYYISIGAEIVPVNPEARVRERTFNASIYKAQKQYNENPSEENMDALKTEIDKAFKTAYNVRIEAFAKAEKKGDKGADVLLAEMTDSTFLEQQFKELTEQRNLYGRIDRMVTFGCNTASRWAPRLKDESLKLAETLRKYNTSDSASNKKELETTFYDLYDKVLELQKDQLQTNYTMIGSFVDNTLKELIN